MGFRFGKSIRLGKIFRLNISKSGIGGSVGLGGLRVGTGPRGQRVSVDLPGGLSYVRQFGGGSGGTRGSRRSKASAPAPAGTQAEARPEPGFFAPSHEKEFVRGLDELGAGRADEALQHFLSAAGEEPGAAVYAASILSRNPVGRPRAVALLEGVVNRDAALPTPLMQKYIGGVRVPVQVTPRVRVELPLDSLAVALLLVELYQQEGRAEDAIGLLEEVAEARPDPALTLSLCELYAEAGAWEGVVECGQGVEPSDDVTLETAVYYGRAMQEQGLHEAALSVLGAALKRKKGRAPELLREAAYRRALSYLKLGRRAQADRELQKIYAEDPTFRDVARLLNLA